MDAELAAHLEPHDPRHGILGTVLQECRCCRTSNPGGISLPPSFPPFRAALAAPIASPTRVYGWLCLLDKVGADDFSDDDDRIAGVLAAQLGRIYENATLYASALRDAAELEREVFERRRAEEALRQNEERFRCAFDHTHVAMVLTDMNHRFI